MGLPCSPSTKNTTMNKSKYYYINTIIPNVKYTHKEWDTICELLKSEFGYTTSTECRKHITNEIQTYADHVFERYSVYLNNTINQNIKHSKDYIRITTNNGATTRRFII